ncbi:MAG: hypothetical protein EP298_10980 [Gammaproteobacteria bacterium]|nr:MAG: hypothetical protein EP298_10980 [Gammaproteobacteria bacterium]UTW41600.1 hypothetical protein KFE69_08780 [bacterium SCSIO 12844]
MSAKEAIKIQSLFRAYRTRKKFQKPSPTKLVHYTTFAVGNDPLLEIHKLEKPDDSYAIVGTGGLRNLSIAHELSLNNLRIKPHIFIIDNSSDVHQFWSLIKKNFQISKSIDDFLKNLMIPKFGKSRCFRHLSDKSFKNLAIKMQCDPDSYPTQNLAKYFKALWQGDNNKFEWCKELIDKGVTLLEQSWTNEKAFKFIKNICDYHEYNIYCYPSNIYECLNNDGHKKLLKKNIQLLKPKATIYTSGRIFPNIVYHQIGKYNFPVLNTQAKAKDKQFLKIKNILENSNTTKLKRSSFANCKTLQDLCFAASIRQKSGWRHPKSTTTTGDELVKFLNLSKNNLLKLEICPNNEKIRMRGIRSYAIYGVKSSSGYFFNSQDKDNEKFFHHSQNENQKEPMLLFEKYLNKDDISNHTLTT